MRNFKMLFAAVFIGILFTSSLVMGDWSGKTLILESTNTDNEGGQINWTGAGGNLSWYQDIYMDKMRFWSSNNVMGDNLVLYSDGTMFVKNSIILGAQDNINEGGHINWTGAGGNLSWYQDIYMDKMRFWSSNNAYGDNVVLDTNGNMFVKNTITAKNYACYSDFRYKTNITPINSALDKILSLQGVTYNWKVNEFKNKGFDNHSQIGFIAQDVEKVFPQLVMTDSTGYKSMSYDKMTAVIVEAMKEMKIKNDTKIYSLEKENALLKNKVESLEKMIERLVRIEKMMGKSRLAKK